jgi:hypothetical protein
VVFDFFEASVLCVWWSGLCSEVVEHADAGLFVCPLSVWLLMAMWLWCGAVEGFSCVQRVFGFWVCFVSDVCRMLVLCVACAYVLVDK